MMVTVICLTITMISTSYSIFFDVKTNDNEQVIQTGNLSVQFTEGSTSIVQDYLYPLSDAEGVSSTAQSVFYVQNAGTTNAFFTFSVKENDTNTLDLKYVKVAVFEYNPADSTSTQISDVIKLSDCIVDLEGNLILYSTNINAAVSKTYSVKVWIADYSPKTIIQDNLDLKLNIDSEVDESVMSYDISGILKNNDGILTNATISLNNKSYFTTTSSSGEFTLANVRPGTYYVKITLSDNKVIQDKLIIEESNSEAISKEDTVYKITGAANESLSIDFTVNNTNILLVEAS